ncbi:molecular chaperone HtpG [Leptospira levettii]|uniref:Chaperone protein HtpG n=1 Tax=Leptospira levettii TaxID=2023178 RepID=A0A5F2AK44_9LEPT|nr:molecular chaperone HtpG [Leptospira levettii]PKA28180.1 molecular chaperone HtpG [Leptospira sp. mixed culture ATI2-C-A1]MCW7467358.1 molecular chaperone HtpG [Leptospira levettii]MCW7473143.1 molecular chaperone HtpG [Leptospira levettii]MCW7498038.1 molecular chaperone HtpG [Leptospira levettii]MCW7509622.1 molecular chaperone HtpG [Leptospira levettii]
MSAEEKGKISVETENIFPIIKKWLYSEKDIFLRELVSNASDAITKLKKVALTEEFEGGSDYRIDLNFDVEKRILSIEDNGIGMTIDEVKKYINQIAFSGATDFAKQYQNAENKAEIIGHFGLGFYSSFMVSKQVTIETKSYKSGQAAVMWSSESGTDFSITPIEKNSRGTKISLYLDSESGEYLDKWKLKELIKKYCDFLPVSIFVQGEKANREKPLWSEEPSKLSPEDYKDFYSYLFPFSGESLFHIHLNVDYPFRLQGILYFPKLTHELEASKNGIKLFCNHVFVSDNASELIPQFLTILKGTIDIPDLPLNVSRSYLQNDPLVKKISNHIIKKVADRLIDDFKKNRQKYEENWNDISIFVKYGVLTDEKFYDAMKDHIIFKNSENGFSTVSEYWEKNKEKNQNKIFYANETEMGSVYMELLKSQGLEALLVDSKIDSHLIQHLEGKNPDWKFQRVDSEIADQILDKDSKAEIVNESNETESNRITKLFEVSLPKEGVQVKVEALKSVDVPGVILLPEFMRRMTEMNSMFNKEDTKSMLKSHTLMVNSKSPLVKSALQAFEGVNPEKGKKLARVIYDLSLLSAKVMDEKEVSEYTKRTTEFLQEIFST